MKRVLLAATLKRARSARATAFLINLAGYAAVAALGCMVLCAVVPRETLFLAGCGFGALSGGLVAIVGGLIR